MSTPSSNSTNGATNAKTPNRRRHAVNDDDDDFILSNKSSFSRLKEQLKELDRRSWRRSFEPGDKDLDSSSSYNKRAQGSYKPYKNGDNSSENESGTFAFGSEENDKELEDLHKRIAAVRARYLEPRDEPKSRVHENRAASRIRVRESNYHTLPKDESPSPTRAPVVTITDHDAAEASVSENPNRGHAGAELNVANDLNTSSSETFLAYLKPRSPVNSQKSVDHHYKAKYLTPLLYDFHNPPRSLSNSPASPLFSRKLDDGDADDDFQGRRGSITNGLPSSDVHDADSFLFPSSRRTSFSTTDYKYSTPEYASRYLRKEDIKPRSSYTPRATSLRSNNPYMSPVKSRYSLDGYTTPTSSLVSSRKVYSSDPDSYTYTPVRRGSLEKRNSPGSSFNNDTTHSPSSSRSNRRRSSLTFDTDTSYNRKSVDEAVSSEKEGRLKTRLPFTRQKHRRSNESEDNLSTGEEDGSDHENNISVEEPGRWVGNGYIVDTALLTADRGYLLWTHPKGKMDVVIRYEDTKEDFSCFIDPQYLGVAVYQIKSKTNKRQIVDGIENPLYSKNPCHKTSPSRTRPENNFELKSIDGEVKLHLEVLKGKHAPKPQLPFKINYTLAL
ncbi:uncharacterized protein LOC106180594 [Lingula anatina]|uniref:Uncharacterized protein LOC106180594 n=1 Tax=Lingula anatina TaxID=7574 RepID=A0A1S3KBQ8_LINAN|nr:uncharacterized protein LOC106180594 [Lingula anatina]|eukprot:XP_013420065.1 uncharacterized protein LOC106180594 [Lingula anatina]